MGILRQAVQRSPKARRVNVVSVALDMNLPRGAPKLPPSFLPLPPSPRASRPLAVAVSRADLLLMKQECCVRSLELDPADAMAWLHLYLCGGGSVNGARWPALKCWNHAVHELGGLDGKGLERCYIRALELAPDNAVAWLGLGRFGGGAEIQKILGGGSYADGQKKKKTCLIRAVELDPDVSPVAWQLLGCRLIGSGKIIVIKGTSYDEEKCYSRALEVDPAFLSF